MAKQDCAEFGHRKVQKPGRVWRSAGFDAECGDRKDYLALGFKAGSTLNSATRRLGHRFALGWQTGLR
jgi:hypothetical protein